MSKTRNSNYDILDKILADADIAERQGGQQWVNDPSKPNGGYMVRTKEEFDRIHKQADDIERYLRS